MINVLNCYQVRVYFSLYIILKFCACCSTLVIFSDAIMSILMHQNIELLFQRPCNMICLVSTRLLKWQHRRERRSGKYTLLRLLRLVELSSVGPADSVGIPVFGNLVRAMRSASADLNLGIPAEQRRMKRHQVMD